MINLGAGVVFFFSKSQKHVKLSTFLTQFKIERGWGSETKILQQFIKIGIVREKWKNRVAVRHVIMIQLSIVISIWFDNEKDKRNR